MKFKVLPLFVIGMSITSVLGSTGCVGTTYTYGSDGMVRVEDHETGEVRLNQGEFCVIVKQSGQPLAKASIDLELTYSIEGNRRKSEPVLSLDEDGTDCFTVRFSRPVSSEDIRLRLARIRVFRDHTWSYGKLKRVEVSEDRTEGRIWMEFNVEDTEESSVDPVGELAYVLGGSTGKLSYRPLVSSGSARVGGSDRNEHAETIVLLGPERSSAAESAL